MREHTVFDNAGIIARDVLPVGEKGDTVRAESACGKHLLREYLRAVIAQTDDRILAFAERIVCHARPFPDGIRGSVCHRVNGIDIAF